MAPVVPTLLLLLAAAAAEAKPLTPPGHHAPPAVAQLLSVSKRGLHSLLARYYGDAHGLVGLEMFEAVLC